MFSGMYFQKTAKIDSKNRMAIPLKTGITYGQKILVAKMPKYYELFLLERINALVDNLKKKFYDVSPEQREEILRDLNYIFSIAIRTSMVDEQGRIVMPSSDFKAGSEVFLQGRGKTLAVFKDEQDYSNYMAAVETSDILRK